MLKGSSRSLGGGLEWAGNSSPEWEIQGKSAASLESNGTLGRAQIPEGQILQEVAHPGWGTAHPQQGDIPPGLIRLGAAHARERDQTGADPIMG